MNCGSTLKVKIGWLSAIFLLAACSSKDRQNEASGSDLMPDTVYIVETEYLESPSQEYSQEYYYEDVPESNDERFDANDYLEEEIVQCPLCYGLGTCQGCYGQGSYNSLDGYTTCSCCDGSGICPSCNGSGYISQVKAW